MQTIPIKSHRENQKIWSILGCGVGLRSKHYPDILEKWPKMDWFEAISENYMDTGGRPLYVLEQVRKHYPVALHGVAMSLGSMDPLNQDYLKRLKILVNRIEPVIVSDHLCWSGIQGEHLHDLLPLPFTEEAMNHAVQRIQQVQEYLGRTLLIENVSTYVTYKHSIMTEWEFLSEISRKSGCGILLDLNNIYVNSRNHGFDPIDYLNGVNPEKIAQFHLAGHTDMGSFLFDTHSGEVINPVWELYGAALQRFGKVSTLIEWDENIPTWNRLVEECEKAKAIYDATPVIRERPKANRVTSVLKIEIGSASVQSGDEDRLESQQIAMRNLIVPRAEVKVLNTHPDLNPQGGVSGTERVEIYAGGYYSRIREALLESYEITAKILGDDLFSELAYQYAREYRSQNYNLSFIGSRLPEFIQTLRLSDTYPFLTSLTEMEWQVALSFHAYDGEAVTPAILQVFPTEKWSNAVFTFQPSVRIFQAEWPLLELWEWRNQQAATQPEIKKCAQKILISRKQYRVQCSELVPEAYLLLKSLLSGKKLGQALEDIVDLLPDTEPPVFQWFAEWVQNGFIQSIK